MTDRFSNRFHIHREQRSAIARCLIDDNRSDFSPSLEYPIKTRAIACNFFFTNITNYLKEELLYIVLQK